MSEKASSYRDAFLFCVSQTGNLTMAFNLGGPRLMRFVKRRKALAVSDFEEATRQAMDSRWACQVGIRAIEICDMIGGWLITRMCAQPYNKQLIARLNEAPHLIGYQAP